MRWLNVRSNVNAKLFMCAFQWNYYQSKTKSSDIISMNTKWKSRLLRGVWKQKIYKSDWFAYIATTPKEFTAYYFDYITAQSLMVETRVKKRLLLLWCLKKKISHVNNLWHTKNLMIHGRCCLEQPNRERSWTTLVVVVVLVYCARLLKQPRLSTKRVRE